MSTLKGKLITPQEIFNITTSVQGTDLGAYAETGDGRGFRYFKNGAVAVVPGKVYQGPAEDATNQSPAAGLGVAAAAAGTYDVTLTDSLTLAANLVAGGFLSVVTTPGEGVNYKIKGNTVVAGATSCVVTLEDPIQTALTTASKVVLHKSPYDSCVVAPTTLTAAVVGVGIAKTPISYYGWLQTKGPASALLTGTFGSAGLAFGVLVGGTEGSLAPAIAGTNVLGYTMGIGATGEYDAVFLTID